MAKPIDLKRLDAAMRVRDVAPLVIAARLADVERRSPARGKIGVDAVHDMRVAVRRLRVALDVFGDGELDADELALEKLQDALGDVRDRHVQIEWLESDVVLATGGAGALAFLESERKRLAVYERKLDAAIERWLAKSGPRLVAHMGRAGARGRLGGKRMARALEKALGRVDKAIDRIDVSLEPTAVHKLRIRIKHLRYLAELLRPGFDRAVGATLERLEPLQDAIGELHDEDVRLARLAAFASSCSGDERAGILALTKRVEQDRARKARAIDRALAAWRAEHTGSALAQLLAA